ncbi:Aste57867_10546 [Aphanomyces stellatus]|uniref:Aste57867_10546 protein n=1 Tax=Aphanomyces stellatus TaxID=120398 RepID=A0A485KQR3_9STRA|nr:hypothetical protein As57867_010506 [Aphanomyces stellatus]VFT87419.1 Aste57867_10546 [Aphanomyces stellatus]
MKHPSIFLGCMATALATLVDAIAPIEVVGTRLFEAGSGKPFQAKGVDYYPRPNAGANDVNSLDFFTDDYEYVWRPHIQEFVALGVNAIRLYSVDPAQSHDKFMCALSAAGIYVTVELVSSCPNCEITGAAYPTCYPPQLKTRGQQVIAAFAKYNNVLGFSAGNEINHRVADWTVNAPCQKKFIRDMRAFVNSCASGMRHIPIGVVLADTDRAQNALYYTCRTDPRDVFENAEWYGLNAYLQCDNAASLAPSTIGAGYRRLLDDFTSYQLPIPSLLTEYGCLNPGFPTIHGYAAQRTWLDAGWLLSRAFADVFAGGFAFEFTTENANSRGDAPFPFTSFGGQNYGLGYLDPVTCDGTPAAPCTFKRMPNFDLLAAQYNASTMTTTSLPSMAAYTPTTTSFPTCPPTAATLMSVVWPSDATADMACPDFSQAALCPGDVLFTSLTLAPSNKTVAPLPSTSRVPCPPPRRRCPTHPSPMERLAPCCRWSAQSWRCLSSIEKTREKEVVHDDEL